MMLPLFRNHIFCYFDRALVAFRAERAACFVHCVRVGAGGAVGGVPRESVHDIEFVVAGEAGHGRGDGTEADLAGSGGEGRHCCGWGAAGRARRWWWW